MMRLKLAAAGAAALWFAASAYASAQTTVHQPPAPAPGSAAPSAPSGAAASPKAIGTAVAVKPAPRLPGYLGKQDIPNAIEILPPPPPKGSTLDTMDNETYIKTRALLGTPRGDLAARDAVHYLAAYDCVLGADLENAATPQALTTLFRKVAVDASAITNLAKDHFQHPRPFIAPNGPICTEDQRAGLMKSYSYPSGHTTYSWALGLILAEIAPDKASDILARARAFGESRVVCGVHTVSDVEEGRTNGAALMAVLHSSAEFKADMDAAKTALAVYRKSSHTPDGAQCKVEREAMIHTPWINPTGGDK